MNYYIRVTVDGKETAWKLECFPNGKQKVGEVSRVQTRHNIRKQFGKLKLCTVFQWVR